MVKRKTRMPRSRNAAPASAARRPAGKRKAGGELIRLLEQAKKSYARLQRLSHRLMEVQEAERRHLAREMHDEIGQALTAAKLNIQQALHAPTSLETGTHLTESIGILDRVLQQVRNIALDLRPSLLDDLGLVPTLGWLVERHSQASEMAVRLSTERLDVRPAPNVELACYRIAQEALTNAAKHSGANQMSIELERSDRELVLLIRDSGSGFDVQAALSRAVEGGSIGLLGMQERVTLAGGEMDIRSAPGQGTEIHARFPLGASISPGTRKP